MKNALWFLYKPQDERERELFYHAYARSFSFLIAALMIGFISLRWLTDSFLYYTIPASLVRLSIAVLIVISYYLGWKTLRKEEITINAQFSKKLPSPYVVWGILGGIVVGGVIAQMILNYYQLPPENYYRDLVNNIFLVIGVVIVRIIAWFSTDKLQLPVRVGLVLAFPFITILVSRMEGKTLSDRIIKALGWLLIPFILILLLAISFFARTYSSSPALYRSEQQFHNLNVGANIGQRYFSITPTRKIDFNQPLFSTSSQDGITTYKDILYGFQFSFPSSLPVEYIMLPDHKLPSEVVLKMNDTTQITASSFPRIEEESPRNIEKKGFKKTVINNTDAWQKNEEVGGRRIIITTFYGKDSQYYFKYESPVLNFEEYNNVYSKVLESFQVL